MTQESTELASGQNSLRGRENRQTQVINKCVPGFRVRAFTHYKKILSFFFLGTLLVRLERLLPLPSLLFATGRKHSARRGASARHGKAVPTGTAAITSVVCLNEHSRSVVNATKS